ncbi:MAG: hypothetical protein MUF87_11690 [Anaerolineae bacterium]|jgi:hypothetical protein|nr:hypothetical protein [Anaerolineae bacterium]
MRRFHWICFAIAVIGGIGIHPHAQTPIPACPSIAADALVNLKTICEATGRDQICYGHPAVIPDFAPLDTDAPPPVFEVPGDLLRVIETRSLQLEALDLENGLWGAALMRVQANLPADSPENVTILIMGGVTFANESDTLQAFTFSVDDRDGESCQQLPPSGLLIQTPEGIGEIALLINQVDIRLGSTAFLRAERDQTLHINLLEGSASVTALDQTVIIAPGEAAQIPLIDLFPGERPEVVPIRAEDVRALGPFLATLPRPIQLPPIETANEAIPVRSIGYGAVIIDTVGSELAHRWQFQARGGDVITVTLEKTGEDAFDPYLELRGADDTILIENDNYLPDGRAGIFNYTLRRSGTYTIVVRGVNGTQGGYKLALSGRAAATITPIASHTLTATWTPTPFATTESGIPNLTISNIDSDVDDDAVYADVTVLNNGTGIAPPTQVILTVFYPGGNTQTFSEMIPTSLAPGESRVVRIYAPYGSYGEFPASALVDPDELIDESNESDNSVNTTIEYPIP